MRVLSLKIGYATLAITLLIIARETLRGQDQPKVEAKPVPERVAADPKKDPTLFFGEDEDKHLDKTPPRLVMGMDLQRLGWRYDCMECHQHVDAKRFDREEIKVEHERIQLEHGNNRYCLNCHHPDNRNSFVDYDGSEIPESQVTMLCAKCHGPKYRDWEAGVHGRQNGFWDLTKGTRSKLRCIQCHDPHTPAFPEITPMAAPWYPKRAAGSKSAHQGDEGGH